MPEKYHISVKEALSRFPMTGQYATVEFREECAGSCRDCVRKNCVYGIFELNLANMQKMKEPQYLYACEGCFRCVQECTRGIFSRVINPDWENLGDSYWTPDIVHQTWVQAENGKVPVSGAGYRGKFAGYGFDGIWTDMSEIVRPTRDGIHGREYINTSVDLNHRPHHLVFSPDGSLLEPCANVFEIPLPVLLEAPGFGVLSRNVLLSMVSAASELGTMMFIRPADYADDLEPFAAHLVPCLDRENISRYQSLIKKSRMIEIRDCGHIAETVAGVKTINPGAVIIIGLELDYTASSRAVELASLDQVDVIHFYADAAGNEIGANPPRFISTLIREFHSRLVDKGLRFRINLVFSGGIAMAEHLAKAIICGADAVAISNPLLIALECRMCLRCMNGKSCPVYMGDVPVDWGRQRILNLAAAWRNQLIEVMGAMGIREVRRLRGEMGRSMWFEDLERESFEPIFGQRKAKSLV